MKIKKIKNKKKLKMINNKKMEKKNKLLNNKLKQQMKIFFMKKIIKKCSMKILL